MFVPTAWQYLEHDHEVKFNFGVLQQAEQSRHNKIRGNEIADDLPMLVAGNHLWTRNQLLEYPTQRL